MKKVILMVVMCLGLMTTATAQIIESTEDKDHKFFNFGLKVGVSVAEFNDLSNLVEKNMLSYHGGLFLELRPWRFLGLSVEGLYAHKSQDWSAFDTSASLEDNAFNLSGGIDVPIMLKLYVIRGFYMGAGIMPSYAIKNTKTSELNSLGQTVYTESTSVQSVSPSVPITLGYQFDFGLCLDVRYNVGLGDDSYKLPGTGESVGRNSINLMVGFRF